MDQLIGAFLYRNQVTIGAGGPYAGKSRLAMHLSINLAQGKPTFLGDHEPIKILYCSERDWPSHSEQMESLGITELPLNDNLRFFLLTEISKADFPNFLSNPLGYIAKTQFSDWKPDLVILDTAGHFQSTGRGEVTNSYTFNRKELMDLKRWSQEHHLSVFMLNHSPKQKQDDNYPDPFDRILGSVAILAGTIAGCIIERDKTTNNITLHFQSHVHIMDTPRIFDKDFKELVKPKTGMGDVQAQVLELVPREWTELCTVRKNICVTLKKKDKNIYNLLADLLQKGWIERRNNPNSDEIEVKRATEQ